MVERREGSTELRDLLWSLLARKIDDSEGGEAEE